MHYDHKFILDQLWPKLPTTTSGVTRQATCGNYAIAEHSENKRKRGGRQVKRQQELWNGKHGLIPKNKGTMTGRGRDTKIIF